MKFYTGRLNFLLLALCFCSQLFAQSPINRLYGTYATETGKAGFVRSDSTMYAVGSSSAFTSLSSQVYLIKTSKTGNLLWSKFFGQEGVDDATDLYYHTDTCIYVVANSYQGPEKGYDIKLIKTDLNGTAIWERNYGTTDWDIPARITRISDSSFAVCGHTYGNTTGLADGMLFAFHENGDSLWLKNFGTVDDDMLYDIALKNKDTIVACGERVLSSGKKRGWLTEFSIAGHTAMSYQYGTNFNYTFNALERMPGGSYAIGITSDSSSGTQNDVFIWKIHRYSHAVVQNIPNYATGDEYCTDLLQHNGNYYMLNNTTSYGLGGYDPLVYRFDTAGGWWIAGYTFGTNQDNFGNGLFINNNGSFTIVGSSPQTFGPRDLWLVNLDAAYDVNDVPDSGFDVNNVEETHADENALALYPNPAHEGFYLRTKDPVERITLLDASGRNILSLEGQVQYVPVTGIATGLYWVNVEFSNGNRAAKKLLVK